MNPTNRAQRKAHAQLERAVDHGMLDLIQEVFPVARRHTRSISTVDWVGVRDELLTPFDQARLEAKDVYQALHRVMRKGGAS